MAISVVKRTMRSLMLMAVAVYGFLFLYFWFFGDSLVFFPHRSSYRDGPGILRIPSPDGQRLAAVHRVNPDARFTILFSHGNAEDLGDNSYYFDGLQQAGFSVFAWDYRGYGLSDGRPSEKTFYGDAETVYDYLTRTLGVPADRIILLGRSLGGAAAVHLAARHPAAGLVLESSFVSGRRVLSRIPLFPFDKFPNLDRLARVTCPVLVIHGTQDRTIPFEHGEILFAAAPHPKRSLWVEGAGHNDLYLVAGERYRRELRQFAEWLIELRGEAAP
ncbi:MAG: alpha/beta hydrolase [Terriglobales bacterium]